MLQRVALKVDVDTLRGTLEGVPALVRTLSRYGVGATFLFSLGPDNTGRALRRVFQSGFLSKVRRTSVVANYGLKTLCYGTLLPAPDIGARAGAVMRSARDAGFEVGVHCNDHVLWQDHVADRDLAWTRRQMELAREAFGRVFGNYPLVHGAAGWQMNRHAFELESELGFAYASDTRGTHPFLPVVQGVLTSPPQLPTTLPTFDELIGLDGCTEQNVDDAVLGSSLTPLRDGHVFTLHAELEGMRLLPALERLLQSWSDRRVRVDSLRATFESLSVADLPRHRIERRVIAGRSGVLACQGPIAESPGIESLTGKPNQHMLADLAQAGGGVARKV
jgi:peptidoglycan/xylan/chitin deacetylase (PgdA/CDA1 family)